MEHQAVDAGVQTVSYARIVELIRAGDAAGAEALYHSFARGFRFLLARSIPVQDLEDKLHDTFIALV